jgi:hypothetical protein
MSFQNGQKRIRTFAKKSIVDLDPERCDGYTQGTVQVQVGNIVRVRTGWRHGKRNLFDVKATDLSKWQRGKR